MPTAAPLPSTGKTMPTETQPTSAEAAPSCAASVPHDIAQLASALWQQRGCPEGSAETDWLAAEQKRRESAVGPTLARSRD